jgi:hypothetical protein
MQFQVPQFLEIEDKIFGPFTFKEFVYLAGGAGLCFILYKLLGLLLGIIPIIGVAAFSLALTFYHPNDKPFINMVEASIKYITQSKLYIWKRRVLKAKNTDTFNIERSDKVEEVRGGLEKSIRMGGNKLKDLAWSLDVLDLKK